MTQTRLQALFANSQRNRKVAFNSYLYGWPIDKQRQAQIALEVQKRIDDSDFELRGKLSDLSQRLAESKEDREFFDKFNPNSSAQVGTLLFDWLEEPIRKRTEQGSPATGKDVLEFIAHNGSDDAKAIAKCLRTRKIAAKLQEAYIHNLSDCDLVRPSAHVTAQVGGRWSYRDPALQTTPPPIKPMFVAHPDCWMVACDLSQAELRSMAQQSGDAAMMRAYSEGRDIHKETASEIFGVPVDKVSGGQRKIAKPLGLGYNYSVLDDEAAAAGLFGQVSHLVQGTLTLQSLLGALKRLDRARPGIRQFKERSLAKAMQLDYVEEPLLRRRRKFWGKVKDTEVYNFPHQAMIAAIVDRAVQGLDSEFDSTLCEGLHLQRHDELIIGGRDPLRLCKLLWEHMRQTIILDGRTMLYEIEFKLTRRWGYGVAIEPVENGRAFLLGCGCKWGEKCLSLEDAVSKAARHYDGCIQGR